MSILLHENGKILGSDASYAQLLDLNFSFESDQMDEVEGECSKIEDASIVNRTAFVKCKINAKILDL